MLLAHGQQACASVCAQVGLGARTIDYVSYGSQTL